MDKHTDGEFANPELDGPRIDRDYEVTSCGNGFFSAYISWSYTSAYHPAAVESGSARRLFDLSRRREVVLEEEIDPEKKRAFMNLLSQSPDSAFPGIYLNHDTIMVGQTVEIPDDPEDAGNVIEVREDYQLIP